MTAYTVFMKHAEKVTKTAPKGRPVLTGVHHAGNGDVYATDSHRLYFLINGFSTETPFTLNTKTGEHIDGNYPDVNRLIPHKDDANVTIKIDVANALAAVKAMNAAHKAINSHNKHVTIEITQNEGNFAVLRVGSDIAAFNATYKLGYVEGGKLETTSVQPQYLQDALALFKDAGEPTITLHWYGKARPLTLSNSDVTALILPVRTY